MKRPILLALAFLAPVAAAAAILWTAPREGARPEPVVPVGDGSFTTAGASPSLDSPAGWLAETSPFATARKPVPEPRARAAGPRESSRLARVFGRVVGHDGEPLAGVRVRLRNFEREPGIARFHEAETAEDGSFSLEAPATSRASLIVLSDDERFAALHLRFESGGELPALVGGDNDVGVLDLRHPPVVERVELTGRVVDVRGRPIESAVVSSLEASVRTKGDGSFFLTVVRRGELELRVAGDGHLAKSVVLDELESVPGAKNQLDVGAIVLLDGPTVSGRVIDQHGDPVPGAQVSGRPYGGASTRATTGEDGRYVLRLSEGEPLNEIEVSAEGYVQTEDAIALLPPFEPTSVRHPSRDRPRVEPGDANANVLLHRIEPGSPYLHEFRVIHHATGAPVESFWITLRSRKRPAPGRHPDGEVSVTSEPGDTHWFVGAPGYAPATGELAPFGGVRTIRLLPGASLHGRLLLDGEPLEGALMTLDKAEQDPNFRRERKRSGRDGGFCFEDLGQGTYEVTWRGDGIVDGRSVKTVFRAGDEIDIGDLVASRGIELVGCIRVPDGSSPEGLEVALYSGAQRIERLSVDAQGRFRVERAPEEELELRFSPTTNLVLSELRVPVPAEPGQVQDERIEVDLDVTEHLAPVRGTVRINGEPAEDVIVRAERREMKVSPPPWFDSDEGGTDSGGAFQTVTWPGEDANLVAYSKQGARLDMLPVRGERGETVYADFDISCATVELEVSVDESRADEHLRLRVTGGRTTAMVSPDEDGRVEVGPLPPGSYGIWLGGERVGAFEVSAGDVKRVRLDLPTNDEP